MTTIAYDGTTLATDSKITADGLNFGVAQKIFELNDGSRLACAGNSALFMDVIDWLNGNTEKPNYYDGDNFIGLLIPKDGSSPLEISSKYRKQTACIPWTGGSGEVIAMTAMKCGKNAIQAVEIACELDIYSGLPVQIKKLQI